MLRGLGWIRNEGVVSEWDLVLAALALAHRQCPQAKLQTHLGEGFLNCGKNGRILEKTVVAAVVFTVP